MKTIRSISDSKQPWNGVLQASLVLLGFGLLFPGCGVRRAGDRVWVREEERRVAVKPNPGFPVDQPTPWQREKLEQERRFEEDRRQARR